MITTLQQRPDPLTPAQRAQHAAEVKALWEAYRRRENARVPVWFAADEQLWLRVAGHTFSEFYRNPAVHLWTQLVGQRWYRQHVIADSDPNPPERWAVGVQLWMEENEFFGCDVTYQDDDYAWGRPLSLSKADLLAHLSALDSEERVRRSSAWAMYQALRDLADGLTFDGRAVDVVMPGRGTHGIFTKAAEVRGLEQLCLDLYEDPEWAAQYLALFTDIEIARIRAWRKLTDGSDTQLPLPGGWGSCDDSMQMLSSALYKQFVLPLHHRLYAAMTTGPRSLHLCGHASQHYATIANELGISTLDGPGPFIDHAAYLSRLPGLSFNAQFDDTVTWYGTQSDIEAMVRGLMTPGAKQPGRFNIVGFVARDTSYEKMDYCYRTCIELGRIG